MRLPCTVRAADATVRQALRYGLARWLPDASDPIVDARGALGAPPMRRLVLCELERHLAEIPHPEILAGIADSGTPWAALLAERTGLAFTNLLIDGPRRSGLTRQLEPDHDLTGKRAVLVDNWISTGASLASAAALLHQGGSHVVGVLTVSQARTAYHHDLAVHVAFPLDQLIFDSTEPADARHRPRLVAQAGVARPRRDPESTFTAKEQEQ